MFQHSTLKHPKNYTTIILVKRVVNIFRSASQTPLENPCASHCILLLYYKVIINEIQINIFLTVPGYLRENLQGKKLHCIVIKDDNIHKSEALKIKLNICWNISTLLNMDILVLNTCYRFALHINIPKRPGNPYSKNNENCIL